jgi:DNA polymerase-3 subunit alpha
MAFADLHIHSEYSVLDGLSTTAEIARRIAENGGSTGALTDHGGCFGHVQWQRDALAAGIAPVFGIETYFQPDRLVRPPTRDDLDSRFTDAQGYTDGAALDHIREAQSRLRSGKHLILLAQSDRGLRDLWAASTEAYVSGFYFKPRMDWAVLEEYGRDLIATSACLGGIISQDLLAAPGDRAKLDKVLATVRRLKSIFGDRFYLEMQGNELAEQRRLNKFLVELSAAFDIPMIATCDAHYPAPADAELHRQWMACQSGTGKDDYWHFSSMLPEQAIRKSLAYLDPKVVDKAIWNTGEIAAHCDARIGGHADPPVFTPGGTAADDARALRAMCERNWDKVAGLGREYRDRMEYEFEVVTSKGLAGCYLIVDDLIRFARDRGFLVGPGRGSAAGSLMSYLSGITSVDPLKAGLLFERFLTPGREALPDFDLDFPTSARTPIQEYAVDKYGSDHVVRVGTIMRYGTKGILKKLISVSHRDSDEAQADAVAIGKIVDQAEAGTAGLGLPWDEIMEDPEIAAFREKYTRIFETAAKLHGRVYAQGQHPAGLIISPEKTLTGAMPMRHASTSDRLLVSQWDYRAAEDLNLLKLDILTLRTLDTMQMAIDLVEQRTGTRLDPRSWDHEHFDPQVYDVIDTGETAGVFQLETSLCREYARRMQPRTLAHLADLTTFIRPGPRNSGATEKYLARRAGTEAVEYPHPLLEEILSSSYGVLLYQEDVLRTCKILAGYSDLEADDVRKLLGKKLMAKIEAAGQEFIRRAVEQGHDEETMAALWADMAEFGRYAFNKAHGFSYGVLSYWTAWLKEHYPAEFLTAVMSTVDMGRLPEFAMEARRIGLSVHPPDVRFSRGGFTREGLDIRYGLSAVRGVGDAAVKKITAGQPYVSYEDFLARSGANAGVVYSLARAGALDALVPSRRGLVRAIEADRDGSSVRCVYKTDESDGPNGLPCSYDWGGEQRGQETANTAVNLLREAGGRKPLKLTVKQPPKRCTVACRRYTPPSQKGMDGWEEYPPGALFRSDLEMYGTWMSDAAFARLDDLSDGLREAARQMARTLVTAAPGSYPAAAVLADVHGAVTRRGSAMWWVKLLTEVSVLDLACFSPRDSDMDVPAALRRIRPGTLVQAEVVKRPYMSKGGPRTGWQLAAVYPLG